MNPSPFLCWRNPLDAVSADFVVECGEARASDFEGDLKISRVRGTFPNDAVLSALADEEFGVGVRKVLDEELRVGPAFGGADFDDPFHD